MHEVAPGRMSPKEVLRPLVRAGSNQLRNGSDVRAQVGAKGELSAEGLVACTRGRRNVREILALEVLRSGLDPGDLVLLQQALTGQRERGGDEEGSRPVLFRLLRKTRFTQLDVRPEQGFVERGAHED